MSKSLIKVPTSGEKIVPGKPVPNNPIIPFIEGDGIGVDITPVMQKVVDAAVNKAYGGKYMQAKNQPNSTAPMSGCRKKHCKPARIIRSQSKVR
jgi:hypothetical protein